MNDKEPKPISPHAVRVELERLNMESTDIMDMSRGLIAFFAGKTGATPSDWQLDGPLYHFWGDGDGDFVNTSLIVDGNRQPVIIPSPQGVPITKLAYERWQSRVESVLADVMIWRVPAVGGVS